MHILILTYLMDLHSLWLWAIVKKGLFETQCIKNNTLSIGAMSFKLKEKIGRLMCI
ncbi:hypothetical protein KDH_58460 [Dictyobacter sp. S3.2.2.5]|uniref:Uncharacterized protein n=1 Tax=Dictyobacter halimunensis TaxID=3026934 RepID=A0ABQ6G318_9CHLR|nr:hypothetical protein KDH_58460 [Dictyobacter sp. S3.2.2.5]